MPDMTPEQNAIQYYRNRSLAFQAACEILLKQLEPMVEVLRQTIATAKNYDSEFGVQVADPMTELVGRLRERFPALKDKTDEEVMHILKSNPQALNQ